MTQSALRLLSSNSMLADLRAAGARLLDFPFMMITLRERSIHMISGDLTG